jgi:hypothetical protein
VQGRNRREERGREGGRGQREGDGLEKSIRNTSDERDLAKNGECGGVRRQVCLYVRTSSDLVSILIDSKIAIPSSNDQSASSSSPLVAVAAPRLCLKPTTLNASPAAADLTLASSASRSSTSTVVRIWRGVEVGVEAGAAVSDEGGGAG